MAVATETIRGRRRREQAKKPKVTVRHVALLIRLREGGMKLMSDLAAASGLWVSQIDELVNEHIELSHPVRCKNCGGLLAVVPCIGCTRKGLPPSYALSPRAIQPDP